MASAADLQAFIDRQRVLLARERDAEIERSALLLSNCSPKLLEQKGLSIGGLGVVGMNIGLGGKTWVVFIENLNSELLMLLKGSLVELDRPSAYHTSPIFPPHNLR
jgi:DNA polymerase alpha-associated DNA helicase A